MSLSFSVCISLSSLVSLSFSVLVPLFLSSLSLSVLSLVLVSVVLFSVVSLFESWTVWWLPVAQPAESLE